MTPDELIQRASSAIEKGDWQQSQAASLLAVTQMLKAAFDREAEDDRREKRYDAQDALLGKLSDDLRQLAGVLEGGASAKLRDIIREAAL